MHETTSFSLARLYSNFRQHIPPPCQFFLHFYCKLVELKLLSSTSTNLLSMGSCPWSCMIKHMGHYCPSSELTIMVLKWFCIPGFIQRYTLDIIVPNPIHWFSMPLNYFVLKGMKSNTIAQYLFYFWEWDIIVCKDKVLDMRDQPV